MQGASLPARRPQVFNMRMTHRVPRRAEDCPPHQRSSRRKWPGAMRDGRNLHPKNLIPRSPKDCSVDLMLEGEALT